MDDISVLFIVTTHEDTLLLAAPLLVLQDKHSRNPHWIHGTESNNLSLTTIVAMPPFTASQPPPSASSSLTSLIFLSRPFFTFLSSSFFFFFCSTSPSAVTLKHTPSVNSPHHCSFIHATINRLNLQKLAQVSRHENL